MLTLSDYAYPIAYIIYKENALLGVVGNLRTLASDGLVYKQRNHNLTTSVKKIHFFVFFGFESVKNEPGT
jgi:hypothetical protein